MSPLLLLPFETFLTQRAMIRKPVAVYFAMCTNIADVWVTVITVLALYILFVVYNKVRVQLRFSLEAFATFWLKTHKAGHFKVYFTMGFQLALEDETMTAVFTRIHVVCMRVPMFCKGLG